MKTIAATSLLFVLFACSKQQPAQEPSDDFEHSSVEHSALGESNPAYSNSNVASREGTSERNGDPGADAPASSNAGPSSPAEPRRVVVERTMQPPSGSNPPAAPADALRPDNAVARDNPVVRAERPDNTGVNERDRSGATKTPLDQSNAQSDLDITQAIRKAVIGDKSLSFNAKNVKIITEGGRVTLRGPVKSVDERAKVVGFAKQAAGVASVDDQLEVAP